MTIHRVPTAGAAGEGYPNGHLGHLTEKEEQALREFKESLEAKGLYERGPPASHDDPTLLRFLRARKWVVQDAYKQFSDTENFRGANQIGLLYDTMDIDCYEESKKLIRHLNSQAVAAYEKSSETSFSKAKPDGRTPAKLLRLFALYENLTRFAQPLCTECTDREYPQTPITLSTNIVDISHVSLRMFWNLKGHMQVASELATAHYPETLDRIFIIGAPHYFGTVWGWIKRWFDPVTVSKIFILGPSDVIPVLTQFMDITSIPKIYGGELEWAFFDDPAVDDEINRICHFENGYETFPPGPLYWNALDDGKRMECLAVGTKDGKDRRERVCTVTKAFPPQSANGSALDAEKVAERGSAPAVTDVPTEKLAVLSVSGEGKQNGTA
ncbi:hypothetical protein DL766_007024 [Monosporascus sp. MC13-8B]|uniref:CRAL-TRIO domain-containing protein n=1 Tax=Monosporascus cannonballus TaxID=155416 RepID=A0ABY0H829_9PEZI|nr:hypothetical protein DL763_008025 [Monosporascus cannonballus]RYO84083.1 hypothetical protein DL762_005829 [Monosporascus cannonballus]RYP25474.1 hypothetical protein DL766_007024 [Monosporascus sp. MC13-8B]